VQQVVRTAGQAVDVDQPAPLPVGVSEAAVAMEEGPEPALTILIAMVLLGMGWRLWRRRASAVRVGAAARTAARTAARMAV
jgi:hypothetical protein